MYRCTTHKEYLINLGTIKGLLAARMTSYPDALVAKNKFIGEGRMQILVGAERLFSLRLECEWVMLPGGTLLYEKCIGVLKMVNTCSNQCHRPLSYE